MGSWEQEVRRLGPVVYRAAWRVLRHEQEAEDVTQEVLLELYRSVPAAEPDTPLAVCVAVRRAIDRLRRRPPLQSLNGLHLSAGAAGPDVQTEEQELRDRLEQAIPRLPPRQAEVFLLRYCHDLTYDDIAAAVGISRDAVAVALHQARHRLREALAAFVEEPNR